MINTLYTSILIAHDPPTSTAAYSAKRATRMSPTRHPLKSMHKALRLAFSSMLG